MPFLDSVQDLSEVFVVIARQFDSSAGYRELGEGVPFLTSVPFDEIVKRAEKTGAPINMHTARLTINKEGQTTKHAVQFFTSAPQPLDPYTAEITIFDHLTRLINAMDWNEYGKWDIEVSVSKTRPRRKPRKEPSSTPEPGKQ